MDQLPLQGTHHSHKDMEGQEDTHHKATLLNSKACTSDAET